MGRWITAYFTLGGVPQTGLTPTIRIRNVSNGILLVTDASMNEIGDGGYRYFFTTYSGTGDYSIRCDGGSTISGSERFTFGGNESFVEDIEDAVWDAQTTDHQQTGSFGRELIDLLKQQRLYNVSFEEIRAVSNIPTRNVGAGRISHIHYKIKNEYDADWSSPVSSGTVYCWYATTSHNHPFYIGEEF